MSDSPVLPPPSLPPTSGKDGPAKKPWWKRWYTIVGAVFVVLLIIAGIAGGGEDDESSDSETTTPRTEVPVETDASADATEAPADTEAPDATEAPADTEAPDSSDGETITIESGFTTRTSSLGTPSTSAGIRLTNTGDAACGVSVQYTLFDEAGTPIETETESIDLVPSGTWVNAPMLIGYGVEGVADMTVQIIKVEDTTASGELSDCDGFYFVDGTVLSLEGIEVVPDQFGLGSIRGQATNPTDELVETAFIDCIFLSGGTIVGGESTALLDPITPGGTIAFNVGILGAIPEGVDSAECNAIA